MFICEVWFALATPLSGVRAPCFRPEAAFRYLNKAIRQNDSKGQLSKQAIHYPLIVWGTRALVFSKKSGLCALTQFHRCDANLKLQNKLSLLYIHSTPCQQLEMTSV